MTSNFESKGHWFLPENKDLKIPGVLKFDVFEGATLELYGTLKLYADFYKPEAVNEALILGTCDDGRIITLYKSFLSFTHTNSNGITIVRYYANFVLVGAHFQELEDLKFKCIKSRIFNLAEWIDMNGFERPTVSSSEVIVNYKNPDDIEFTIDENTNGKLSFFHNFPMFGKISSIRMNQFVNFEAYSKVEHSLSEILSFHRKFQNFLIFALYQSTHPESIILHSDNFIEENEHFSEHCDIHLYFPISSRNRAPKILSKIFNVKI
ncbi:MAG: hypothetical protein EOO43_09895 [Flavobacterium sp.]|nr:MAG: hypothetical protein EOO43_09895 [Flavobacterium sp.]